MLAVVTGEVFSAGEFVVRRECLQIGIPDRPLDLSLAQGILHMAESDLLPQCHRLDPKRGSTVSNDGRP